jgi:hypothetical protein
MARHRMPSPGACSHRHTPLPAWASLPDSLLRCTRTPATHPSHVAAVPLRTEILPPPLGAVAAPAAEGGKGSAAGPAPLAPPAGQARSGRLFGVASEVGQQAACASTPPHASGLGGWQKRGLVRSVLTEAEAEEGVTREGGARAR